MVGQKPDCKALRNLRELPKRVQWMWLSLSRSLEVKGKEVADILPLTIDKVARKGRAQSRS